jgi:hypothetical protein
MVHFLLLLLITSVQMLASFSSVSSAHAHLLRSSPAFHSGPTSSSLHPIQQTFVSLEVEDLIGPQGEPIPVKILLPSPSLDGERRIGLTRFLIFRGLPEAFVLSAGFRTKSAWMVSAADLPNLQLRPPPDFRGAMLIEVMAHSADGRIVARNTVPIIINPGYGKVGGTAHGKLSNTESGHGDQQLRTAFEVFLDEFAEHGPDGAADGSERDALYAEFVRWWINTHTGDAE